MPKLKNRIQETGATLWISDCGIKRWSDGLRVAGKDLNHRKDAENAKKTKLS